MSGGQRYWNEEAQRWEDADQGAAPVTPPPPGRPDHVPPPTEPTAPADPSAQAESTDPPAPADPSAQAPVQSASPVRPSPPAVPWPGAGPGQQQGGAGTSWPPSVPPVATEVSWSPSDPPGGAGASWHPSGPPAADVSWPPSDRPSVPAAAGGHSRRVVWTVVAVAAAVGVATSLVLVRVVGGGDDGAGHRGAAGTTATHKPAQQQTDATEAATDQPSSPSPSATALPADYETHDDVEGFRIAVPKGWKRSTVPSKHGIDVVNFRSPDSRQRLQVYEVAEESPDASFELYLSPGTPKPDGFEKLALDRLDDGDFVGSRLEYLADSIKGEPDVGTWHAVDERFEAPDGKIYAVAAYGPDADGRDDELALLNTALKWFCAPGATCGEPTPG
ncbi:hypothetical protein ACWCP6_04390 [Streptomyces sp. NPDC002004]